MKKLNIGCMALAAFLAAGVSLTASAAAKTVTWTGGGDGCSWSDASNWDQGVPVNKTDYVIFNTTLAQPIVLNGDKTVADFFMSGCSAAFTTDAVGVKRQLSVSVLNGCGHDSLFLENGTLEAAGSNNTVAVSSKTTTTSAILGSGAVLKASDGGQVTLTRGKIAADAKNVKFIATGKQGATCSKVNESSWYPTTMTLTDENTGFSFEAYDGGIVNLGGTLNFVNGNNPVFIADGGQLTLSKAVITGGSDLFVTNMNAGVTTLGAITGNPTILAESGKVTTGAIVGNSTIDASSGAIVTPATKVTGNTTITAKDARTYVTMPVVVGDSVVDCADSATVKFSSTIAGNVDSKATNGAYVLFANTLTKATEPYKFYCDNATNKFDKGVTGTVLADCANNGKITFSGITGSATVTSTNGAIVTTGAVSANADMFAKDAGSSITLSSFGVAGGSSKLKASDTATITSGATKGSVAIEADKGALVKLTSTLATGTHSITSSNENSVVWIQGGVTGATTIDASDKGTVKLVNSGGTTFYGITGTTTISAAGDGATVQLAGFGAAGTDSSVTATGKALVKATGSVAGNVSIEADESTVTTGAVSGNATVESDASSVTVGAVTGTAKVNSTGAGSSVALTSTIGKGDSEFTCTDSASITVGGNISGNVKIDCDASSYVKISGTVSGTVDMDNKNHGYVWFANTLGSTTAPQVYAFDCDSATNRFDKAVAGAVTIDAKNGANMTLTSGFGAAGKSSSLTATEQSSVTSGATLGNMAIVADKGSAVTLTSTVSTGTHSIACSNENSVVWIRGAVTGATTIDASDKGTVKLVDAAGTTYQKITGATTISCTGEGTSVTLAGFGNTGLNSSVMATDKGSILAGASLGNVALAADKGASVTLTSTIAAGDHAVVCSNENSLVWVKGAITGNPTVTCKDKGTINIASYTGNPTILCSGEGSSVTNGNITGDKKVPVSITCSDKAFVKTGTLKGDVRITCSDGATVQTGSGNTTAGALVLSVDSSAGGLVKLGAVTLVDNGNSFVANDGTIQLTGTFTGNKSFTSVYEVKGDNGAIEGANVTLNIGSDSKTTVKLTPTLNWSEARIRTIAGGDVVFGTGVQYVIDVTEISKGKPFFGEKKILVAEAAGSKLTLGAASSITTTGTDAEFYTASFEVSGKQLYLVLNCTKIPAGKVAVVGTEDFYDSLADALAAVPDNGLVAVLADSTVAATIANPLGKTVTLNINGKTLTNAVQGHLIENFGTLILKGNGLCVGDNAAALVRNAPTGTLTIESGTFKNSGTVVDNAADAEYIGQLSILDGSFTSTAATAIRNGGATSLSAGAYVGACAISNDCVLAVSGGTFTGSAYALYNCCTTTVSKGTFAGLVTCGTAIGDLTVNGGTFDVDVTTVDGATVFIPGLVGTTLNGATFVNDETAFCEEGYLTFRSGDVYVVCAASQVIITASNANEELGTLKVDNEGETISEFGATLTGTLTGVAAGYEAFVLVDGVKVVVDETTGAFSGTAGKSAVVVAAYARKGAWYLDPFVRNVINTKLSNENSQSGALDLANDRVFFGTSPGVSSGGFAEAAYSELTNSVNPNLAMKGGFSAQPEDSDYFGRSIAALPKYRAVLSGNSKVKGKLWVTPYGNSAIPGREGSVAYQVGLEGMPSGYDSVVFMPIAVDVDSKYMYGTYSDYMSIHQFEIVADENDLNKVGKLVWIKSWSLAERAGYGLAVARIGGKDILYAKDTTAGKLQIIDTTSDEVRVFSKLESCTSAWCMGVSGIASGTPHLVTGCGPNTSVYALSADGLSLLSASPIATFETRTLVDSETSPNRIGIALTDDETYAFIADGRRISGLNRTVAVVVEPKPANMIVRGTFSDEENAEDDVLVAYGADASVTFNAPTGKKITAVKINGTAAANFTEALSYTFAQAALVKNVYIEMTLADRKFDVTFMDGESAYYSTNIVYGTTVLRPADPMPAAGYSFSGWTNATYAAGFDFATPITDDLTLHARYDEIPVTGIALSDTTLVIRVDDVTNVTATVIPAEALVQTVTWDWSAIADFAEVTVNGNVITLTATNAMAVASTPLAVTATAGGQNASFTVTIAANGPKTEEGDEAIEVKKDDSQLGGDSYTVDSKDPTVTEVTFTSIDAKATVRVKPSITRVTGVEPANIVVLNGAGNPIPKAALVGGTSEGYSTELNEEAKVPVTVGETEVQIPVQPTIGEQIDGLVIETPFVAGDTTAATIAAVPGLTYELKSYDLATGSASSIGEGVKATADETAKVTLTDDRTGEDKPTQEFYVIEVTK